MKLTGGLLVWILLGSAAPRLAGAVTVQGTLLYEKIPATVNGLDLEHPVEVPAARVEVTLATPDGTVILARGATDEDGSYRFEVPDDSGPIRLFAWAQWGNLQVVDPDTHQLYGVISSAHDPSEWPGKVLISDYDRLSGPFNILATLRRANRLMEQIEPGLPLADQTVTIYWSPIRNHGTLLAGNAIFVNGRRDLDSDEFDDPAILIPYAEYLLRRFSPVLTPVGQVYTDVPLDPRLAWVEGWKLFFALAVLGTPVVIDTSGPHARTTFSLDLDQDRYEGVVPGYGSMLSVTAVLWDIYADRGSEGPHLGLGLRPIWQVMREYFPPQVFPHLITLADGLIQQDGSREAGITEILARQDIRYQFGQAPPVPLPFPRRITPAEPVTGHVDSLTSGETSLLEAADYYLVAMEKAGSLRMRLTITGEPAPGAGFLELLLFNARGEPIKGVRSWLRGAGDWSELVVKLPPGRYVIGVRSYSASPVKGNAEYRLTAEF